MTDISVISARSKQILLGEWLGWKPSDPISQWDVNECHAAIFGKILRVMVFRGLMDFSGGNLVEFHDQASNRPPCSRCFCGSPRGRSDSRFVHGLPSYPATLPQEIFTISCLRYVGCSGPEIHVLNVLMAINWRHTLRQIRFLVLTLDKTLSLDGAFFGGSAPTGS
jgi:hypothetical protein